ncbi:F-box/LRR-repeat protein 25-like [Rutidosis leptorrhynchoides]|uniref:F-box/LRR-repeat protein 25-like n=1 Tax=Rutidosis leptorrhynchoides TaxID=125765 RepID=UPI003A99FBC7
MELCGQYMMKTQSLSSDIISSLPQNIIENILTFMPIRDALRTSILSKKWRYCWMTMPKLVFDHNLARVLFDGGNKPYEKSKLVNAIFHVLFIHSGPTILEFKLPIHTLGMMYGHVNIPIQECSMTFVDLQDDLSLTLDHLEHFEIANSSNIVFLIEFVKLIMGKSHVLKLARIELEDNVCVEEELKICKEMIYLPFPRASPSAKLIVERRKTS